MDSLTFCIPAYNDDKTIALVIQRAKETARALHVPYAICVVNDGSTDDTENILRKLARHTKELSIIAHAQNRGYGATMRQLYTLATTSWLFTVPGDYQIDPAECIHLWNKKDDWDIVIGERVHRHDGAGRLFQTAVYRMILGLLFGLRVRDVDSVKLMRTSVIKDIALDSTSAFVDAQLVIGALRAGKRITEVPITHKKRQVGHGGGGKFATIWPTIVDMMKFRFMTK